MTWVKAFSWSSLVLHNSPECHSHSPSRPHSTVGGFGRRTIYCRRTDCGGPTHGEI